MKPNAMQAPQAHLVVAGGGVGCVVAVMSHLVTRRVTLVLVVHPVEVLVGVELVVVAVVVVVILG